LLRLGIKNVKTIISDAKNFNSSEKYDKILIDAPCSNTGVLNKRPDARWKRQEEDIQNLAEIQYQILSNASKYLKTGGCIVYSTCSIEQDENIKVIEKFLINNPEFCLEDFSNLLPWKNQKHAGYIQIIPSVHKIEGFFIAKLKYK